MLTTLNVLDNRTTQYIPSLKTAAPLNGLDMGMVMNADCSNASSFSQ